MKDGFEMSLSLWWSSLRFQNVDETTRQGMIYMSDENSPIGQKDAILKFNLAEISCWVFEDKKNSYIINY